MSYVWHKQGQELLSEIQSFLPGTELRGHVVYRTDGNDLPLERDHHLRGPGCWGLCRMTGAWIGGTIRSRFCPRICRWIMSSAPTAMRTIFTGRRFANWHRQIPRWRFYVPKPLTEVVAGYGIRTEQVKGIHQDEPSDFREGFSVRGVATAHEEYQYDEEGASRTLGYVFRLGDHRLLHAGDTVVTQKLIGDLKEEHGLDAAMVPINGRDLERHARGIVGNMEQPRSLLVRIHDRSGSADPASL